MYQHPKEGISVDFRGATLEDVLLFLKNEAGFYLLYNSNTVKEVKNITFQKVNATVESVLDESLRGTDLTYVINENKIVLKTRKEAAETVTAREPQARVVKGKVIATKTGEALAGATVHVKGSSLGVVTDANGEYTLSLESDRESVLVFSFMGMITREIKFAGQTIVNVALEERVMGLAEVVVSTGYQKIDKRESASSIFTIKGEEVIQGNAISIDNMLQGKVPGMMVLNSTSTPGAAPVVRVRGTSTISGNREPLWVVDGMILDDPVPIPTEELNNLDNVNLIGNAISGLNPMDIEDINVLKDASATAIYGVRAANGVIVITTKRGRTGVTSVNYSGTFSATERPGYKKLRRMNSLERVEVSKEIEKRALAYGFPPAKIGYEGLLMDYYDRKLTTTDFLQEVQKLETLNTDWFDLIFRTAFTHKHNVSMSGANDKLNYYFSMAYTDADANVKNNETRLYNAMMKLEYVLSPKVKTFVQLMADLSKKKYFHSSINAYQYAYETSRAIPAYDEEGNPSFYNKVQGYNNQPLVFNFLHEAAHSGRSLNGNNIHFNANIEWRLLPGLRATGTFNISAASMADKEWYDENTYKAATLRMINYGKPLPTDKNYRENYISLPYGGELKNDNTHSFSYTLRGQLDYNKLFGGQHSVTLVAGTEARSLKYEGIRTTRWGYLPERGEKFVTINPVEWPMYQKMVDNTPNVVTNRLTNTMSFYGVAAYSFRSRYIFNANVRADGSNKFGQDPSTRFLPIWSVSGRWNLHNEAMLTEVMWLNDFAIKTSYGIQGNVADEQTPSMILNIGPRDELSGYYMNYLSVLPNPLLKWEKTNSFNVGVDFALFSNRISGTFEYYYKKGRDQIVRTEVVPTVGVTSMSINVGDIMNKGYEMILNVTPVRTKNFTWSLHVNGGRNVNRITRGETTREYSYMEYINATAIVKGKPINSFYSYKFDKLNERGLPTFFNTEEITGTTREEMYAEVFEYSGKRIPDIQGGLGNTIRYKNLTLNLFFSYSLGSKVRMNNLYSNSGQRLPNPEQNMSQEFVKRWRQPGDEAWATIPTLSTEDLSNILKQVLDRTGYQIPISSNGWQMYNHSNIRVVPGDFLRLRTLSLRYHLPRETCNKFGAQMASLRLEGNNIFTLASKKLSGQDPEQIAFGGIGATTPPVSSFTLGIDISF
ncbi:MAG: SusC/RagA family TonB-linked outer membrane protein [Odoribacteraceae bacterium]|nr:SusC/RagA family TonB-linked outer membrane protein [Odoribacteraceae bacterium]